MSPDTSLQLPLSTLYSTSPVCPQQPPSRVDTDIGVSGVIQYSSGPIEQFGSLTTTLIENASSST